ncbi:MAG: MscS Mechanosensitive ion channel [Nocardioides sp.]|nr:MscS Mechanosensitive ion channel [Nocardioides sp.]
MFRRLDRSRVDWVTPPVGRGLRTCAGLYILVAMFGLETQGTCDDGHEVCNLTFKATNNQTAADAADILIGKPLAVLGLVLLLFVTRWLLHRLVDRLVARAEDGVLPDRMTRFRMRGKAAQKATARDLAISTRRVQRAKTMGDLLKSVVTGILVAIIGTMILSEVGVNIAPIIASAGILGLALGFGAQSLVKDFLSGIFMIFEDQYGVGDVVDVGEASGTVEAVSLRVTRLRDLNGTVWYVPNGAIPRVGNMSQNWSRAVVDVNVSYREDLVRVQRVLREVAHDLWEDEDFKDIVIEEPEVTGVEVFAPEAVTLRVLIKTAPMEQWGIARALRQRIKTRFDHEGIEIPLPQRVVWNREEKTTGSPSAEEEPVTER